MRKRIAKWLVGLSRKIYTDEEFVNKDIYEPKKLGLRVLITKSDVKKFRDKIGTDSMRTALDGVIDETEGMIAKAIFDGCRENGLINYNIKKSLYSAEVAGTLYVYAKKSEEGEDGGEAPLS